MPELPEVQTIVSDLSKILPGLKIRNVWTDWKKMIKIPKNFELFKKNLIGKKILKVKRIGKNILIDLSDNQTLLIHQKMTGHLLYGKWKVEGGKWVSEVAGPLKNDPQNRFLHLVIDLSNGRQLALSDLRKFAKILIWKTNKLKELEDIKNLGPDPLDKSFTFGRFKEIFQNKKGKIKKILMEQNVIAGIGNIYSDEILWESGIHPLSKISHLKEKRLKKIYKSIKKILARAIKVRGDSTSDYRDAHGKKGGYQEIQNAYQMEDTKCKKRDGGTIKRVKVGGRSAHFCPAHQIQY